LFCFIRFGPIRQHELPDLTAYILIILGHFVPDIDPKIIQFVLISVWHRGCNRLRQTIGVTIHGRGKRMPELANKFYMIAGGPKPVAPFSHAVESDGFIFVTGQMPDTPDAPGALPDGIEAQTLNVMSNLRIVLAGLGLGFEHVLVTRAYLTRFREDYAAFNAVYSRFFNPKRLPARTCVGVTGLAYDALVEIDLLARRP
jgi:2-iminobutanoate/2-iminopropanoate deaminase